jgi:CrcB protein
VNPSTDPDLPPRPTLLPRGRLDVLAVIAAGGALGGAGRWALNQTWPTDPGSFPWATFTENVLGCLLLGALMVFLLDVWRPGRYLRPFLAVGVLGGFTTFSAYTNETRVLLQDGRSLMALAYVFASVLAGLLATVAGLAGARALTGTTPRRTRRRTT